ncbi:hypothetical protein LZC95_39745 [Pendulispora brunnea]|uniref:Uncharacterized protein n=1 Tax=Pendulispora brunnea TaxID=2905690 RepID=A0ABZ2K3A4_9BACT
MVIHVHSGSKALSVVGWVVFGAGTVTTLTGFALLLGRRLVFQPGDRDDDMAGAMAVGVGATAAIGGLALVLMNRRTTISQDIFPRAPDDRPSSPGTPSLWPQCARWTFPLIGGYF